MFSQLSVAASGCYMANKLGKTVKLLISDEISRSLLTKTWNNSYKVYLPSCTFLHTKFFLVRLCSAGISNIEAISSKR